MPTYTLKSNAINSAAQIFFVGDNGLTNLIGGGAVTKTEASTGSMAATTVAGRVVYGDAAGTGNSLSAVCAAAIAANQAFSVLIVGHLGLSVNTDRIALESTAGIGIRHEFSGSGPRVGGYFSSWGWSAAAASVFSGYVHPDTGKLRTTIMGREPGSAQKHYADGVAGVAFASNTAIQGHSAAANSTWTFGGSPNAAAPGGYGVAIAAVFIGIGPTALADFITANGTGTTEADKVYSALLEVVAGGTAPSITTQPSNASVAAGATATFTAAASGSPAPTYQWQRNPGGVGSWADIASATSASYTTPATTVSGGSASNGDTYRVVATNASGSATSTAATLTVSASNAAPTFPGPSISNLSITQGAAMTAVNVAGRFSDTDALTFSAIGTWPAGVTVSSAGVISGTPTVVGNYTGLTVRATDTAAQTVNSNSFSITVTAVMATLNFQAAGMEFGARTGLGISTFALDVGSGYRYTVHADGLTLGAALYTSGVVTTDSAGKLPNLVDASITAGVTYRVHAVRQSDGAAATFKMVAA